MGENREENLVKKVCRELEITQKELAKKLDVTEQTVVRWVKKPEEITPQSLFTLNLLLENSKLQSKVDKYKSFFNLLDELKDDKN